MLRETTDEGLNAQIIISCNLPFSFLSCELFRNFVKNLNPNYNMITLSELEEEKIKDYSNKIKSLANQHINFETNYPLSIIIDEWKS